MEISISLTEEDMKSVMACGYNIKITTEQGLEIILTQEAFDELDKNVRHLRKTDMFMTEEERIFDAV